MSYRERICFLWYTVRVVYSNILRTCVPNHEWCINRKASDWQPCRQQERSIMKTKPITIPEWHEWAKQGAEVPMRITINGVSMYPLIRRNRDMVTIIPLDHVPVPGEIVMFARPQLNRYVLHRVWQVCEGRVLTWGDNCDKPDGWIPREMIWGQAIRVERGRRDIRPDPVRGLRWAKVWHPLGRTTRRIRKLAYSAYNMGKHLLSRSN